MMLWIIWILFAILFLALAYYHWMISTEIIPPLKITPRPYKQSDSPIKATARIAGIDIDKPLEDFVCDFNDYLNGHNKSSRRQNRFQACGYLLASLTAVFSIFLTI